MTDQCECILVNDGSTDNSRDIAEHFCWTNPGFQCLNKENGGLSDARNYGLQHAIGEYVIFVDSDDVVSPVLIEALSNALKFNNSDVVYFNFIKFFNSNAMKELAQCVENVTIEYAGREKLARMPNFAWARVAKRKIYDNNRFPIGVIYEDVYTSPYITQHASVVAFIDSPLYGYRKRSGSITTISAEKQFELFEAVSLLRGRYERGEIDFIFYSTAFVNLSQSCVVSLVRIDNSLKRAKYRRVINQEFNKLTLWEIIKSFSNFKFKILS
ncbi:TPA: glycosyltransferase family 2 protein, partial [Enterobacter kobei]